MKLAAKALEQAAALGGGADVLATLEQARSLLGQVPRCVRSFTGQPPYAGQLAHPGWEVASIQLPDPVEGHDARIVAPAEVELP